ncbi:MAG: hypothetical protein QOK25_1202 [Thermoleophilaceae bacterium]|jgi:hypothetical protein|nr:hypothetical protein [Thermoleophilaceae bacterium]
MGYRLRALTLALALGVTAVGASAPAASADSLFGQQPPASTGGVGVGTGPSILPGRPGPEVAGTRAVVVRGVAYAPSRAPLAVKMTIWAANKIRHKPYKWGGGHARWNDSGYDCSGSVSYALHGGGLIDYTLASTGFMRWGDRGAGRWISVYASKTHTFMIVAGLRFDTSGAGESGPRWRLEPRWERNFKVRHPTGL